jgi:2,4-dienoyl-CoA reductase-like NADH-dependent reductase (Old Yellow Enzyme family)
MSTDILFRPFSFKSLNLKNRIVMAPMTRSFSPGGVPTDDVAAYYRRRAENDVGLILSEGTVIDRPASSNDPNVPRFHGEDALAGWKKVRLLSGFGVMGSGLVVNRPREAESL